MKKIILLKVLCFPFFVSAQEVDTNASIFSEVSEYRNYQELYLSNLGQAKLHLTSPFQLNNRNLRSLFPTSSNSETYTDVFYITGSGGENYVDLEHHQRLGKLVWRS